jgi:hypothetical protein
VQNSTLTLIIPYTNESATVEAQNEGPFNTMGISSGLGLTVHFTYFDKRKETTAL